MAKETKYGVISDIHWNPRIVPFALEVLKKQGVEKLLVNGDIGKHKNTLQESQNYTAEILGYIGQSGLESFIQPGSHENILAYSPVIEHFSRIYSNIIDVTKNQKIEQKDHTLVFLPGSDFLSDGEYQIGNHEKIPSGRYIHTDKGLIQFEELAHYILAVKQGLANGAMQYQNMSDLKKLVTHPDKTSVICHIPRKFNNIETCVDVAEFGEIEKPFFADIVLYEDGEEQIRVFYKNGEAGTILKPKNVASYVRNQSFSDGIFPLKVAEKFLKAGAPIKIKKENRGNEDLKKLYEELGITKAISSHFHESGHKAHDSKGISVPENQLVSELFWNSGQLDKGQTGIITISENKIKYKNIKIQDYV